MPGVIHFLSEVIAARVDTDRALSLLEGSVKWLLAQQRTADAVSRYDSFIAPGRQACDSRLGWCYGDLGIAAVLCQVARRMGRNDWREIGTALLDRCLEWPIEKARIYDASLCHGALGVAHVFNRAYQSTGDEKYKSAANTWYAGGMQLRQPEHSTAGFFAWAPDQSPQKQVDGSFLSGAIGAALALLSAVAPIEPRWDRLMLLSGCKRV